MKRLPIIIILITSLLNLCIGCSGENQTINPTNRMPNDITLDQFDFEPIYYSDGMIEVIGGSISNYDQGSSGHYESIINIGEIQAMFEKFESEGYSYDPVNSFIIEGIGVPEDTNDSIAVRVTNIIMRNDIDSTESLIWISHTKSTNRTDLPEVISTSILSFVPPAVDVYNYEEIHLGTDEYGIERYVWIKGIKSSFMPKYDNTRILWDWKSWAKCTLIGTISGCIGYAAKCVITGPAYGQCIAAGCAGSMLASSVGCALYQLSE